MNGNQRDFRHKGEQRAEETAIPDLLKVQGHILQFSHAPELDKLINLVKKLAEHNCRELKSHQLRRLYDEVRKKKTANEIQLLRAKFAYAMARQTSKRSKDVIGFFDSVMAQVKEDKQVGEFRTFFEAVVAYHKFYHGNN